MNTRKRLTNVISKKYITKFDKYVVELGIYDEPKVTVWLTEKQVDNLDYCFDQTKLGYSDKNISVYGIWSEKGYFAYSEVVRHEQSKQFRLPQEQDVSDLWEVNDGKIL
ncbi:hypothetical protein [Streptococcus sobrinus]|uniref:hypothetical protein n=1 Tax=Streptococcus sobrinus TaxID=1310 RepID=UPI0003627859|nr:hypothetical protein [Streptococcus sobrinus]